ncbi:c-type cytochrome biogenesis protein CcmI [Aureimonas ureilytica]|uniref:c-type cytochrome biogenesis protein CcmI n=1 Tax=Aureimonas ureilytica TaxID=401562 RepID=UPI003CEB5AB6
MFWLVAALMTLVATIATVRPLLRGKPASVEPRSRHDAEVYRAQLAELEADRARGAIGEPDAATARAEIARRLLKAESASQAATSSGQGRAAIVAGLFVALLLPAATFLFYDRAGSPELGDLPLASRESEPAPTGEIGNMLAAVERRLAEKPDDGTGWSVVAPVYLRMGEPDKAVAAYRNALRLTPPTADMRVGLGEALVQQAHGQITDEAREAFRSALALDANSYAARFYLALDLSQAGRYAEARDAWSALVASSPADAPWLGLARSALADAQAQLGAPVPAIASAAPEAPGPSAADMAAAETLSADDRRAMIEGMVSQLAGKLQAAPEDAEGWRRLMRSYVVLGRRDEAAAAGRQALGTFSPETAEGKNILAFAQSLGLSLGGDAATP